MLVRVLVLQLYTRNRALNKTKLAPPEPIFIRGRQAQWSSNALKSMKLREGLQELGRPLLDGKVTLSEEVTFGQSPENEANCKESGLTVSNTQGIN